MIRNWRSSVRSPLKSSLQTGVVATQFFLSGCQIAPSVNILGSYFPAWLLCITSGILVTVALRLLLVRYAIEEEVGPPPVIYPSLAVLVALGLWLVFIRS
jgi:hypothetical protein